MHFRLLKIWVVVLAKSAFARLKEQPKEAGWDHSGNDPTGHGRKQRARGEKYGKKGKEKENVGMKSVCHRHGEVGVTHIEHPGIATG